MRQIKFKIPAIKENKKYSDKERVQYIQEMQQKYRHDKKNSKNKLPYPLVSSIFSRHYRGFLGLNCLLIWIFNHFCLIIWCFNHFVLLLTIHTEHCASKLAIPKTVHNKPSSYQGSLARPVWAHDGSRGAAEATHAGAKNINGVQV
jgi:hypothetical protein